MIIKPIHPEMPAINSSHLCWDAMIHKVNKNLRYDGSREDYWTYLHILEDVFQRLGNNLGTKIGPESAVKIPPVYAQYVNARYWRRQHANMPFYILDDSVRDALMNTDLSWVDAEAFLNLPDALGIVINPPDESLSLFRTGGLHEYHPISDFLLFRITDPEHRARLCNHHGRDAEDPGIQVFYWMALSREEWKEGTGGMNFGSFCISQNVKLADFSKQLAEICRISAEQNLALGMPKMTILDHKLADFVKECNKVHTDFFRDLMRTDEQAASLAVCEAFLLKFVLLHSCDWFQAQTIPMQPPGIRTFPNRAKQLWLDWGKRYRVVLPAAEAPAEGDPTDDAQDHERRSPIRHWVRGFFRNQPFGPGRAKRKVIWVAAFWRGKIKLG